MKKNAKQQQHIQYELRNCDGVINHGIPKTEAYLVLTISTGNLNQSNKSMDFEKGSEQSTVFASRICSNLSPLL